MSDESKQDNHPVARADDDGASLMPERRTWLRATVSVIPYVGGALDHLLFDRADSIRLRNIESALSESTGSYPKLA